MYTRSVSVQSRSPRSTCAIEFNLGRIVLGLAVLLNESCLRCKEGRKREGRKGREGGREERKEGNAFFFF